jgi:hypothetical protein
MSNSNTPTTTKIKDALVLGSVLLVTAWTLFLFNILPFFSDKIEFLNV